MKMVQDWQIEVDKNLENNDVCVYYTKTTNVDFQKRRIIECVQQSFLNSLSCLVKLISLNTLSSFINQYSNLTTRQLICNNRYRSERGKCSRRACKKRTSSCIHPTSIMPPLWLSSRGRSSSARWSLLPHFSGYWLHSVELLPCRNRRELRVLTDTRGSSGVWSC